MDSASTNNSDTFVPLTIIPAQNTLGENVLWHPKQQAIYWIDIEEKQLLRYQLFQDTLAIFPLPHRIGSFAFSADDSTIFAAFEQGFAYYNFETSHLIWLSQPEKCMTGNRFNDGRADRQGRFWAGTMVEKHYSNEQHANLYRLGHDLKCEKMISDLSISNGLCWSKNGRKLFHSDSVKHKIHQYDCCVTTGNISNRQVFATTLESAFPDGSTIDSDDFLWNAQWGSSHVVRYNRNGKIDCKLKLPISQPSCVALGGPNLDWLIVTSARQDLSQQQLALEPEAGNLFIYQLKGITGIEEPICTINVDQSFHN